MYIICIQVHRNGKQVSASIRGNREVGVVKWVKESYGFIQSAGVHSVTFLFCCCIMPCC